MQIICHLRLGLKALPLSCSIVTVAIVQDLYVTLILQNRNHLFPTQKLVISLYRKALHVFRVTVFMTNAM